MRKPGARHQAEHEWDEPVQLQAGQASPASGPNEASRKPKAVLWVPDCEQRHFWREFYVYADEPPKDRRAGFRP